jgi:zinc resistance-associated protein
VFTAFSYSGFIVLLNSSPEVNGMKRLLAVALVVAVGLAGTLVYGQGYGAGASAGPAGKQVDVNALRQFQKETLPLRDEMHAKRLELFNEYNKQTPDQDRIAQLQKEMIDLRTKIRAAAEKNGVQGWTYGRRGAKGYGRGFGPGARGAYWGCPAAGYGPGAGAGSFGGPGAGGRGYGRCFW